MNTCTHHKPPGTGPLRNGNHRGDPNSAPRCGAKTRAGTACKSPAMKNGRCRMHGGKCLGPTTQAGRDRISAARDQGKGWSKQWKPINDAQAALVRRVRVLVAISSAKIALAEVAPLIRDLRRTIGQADPGYTDNAALYAGEAVLALSGDRLAMRALIHAIRETGRRRRTARRPARPTSAKTQKNAIHRENTRPTAAMPQASPPTPPARGDRDPHPKNPDKMPCTVTTPPPLNRKQRRRLAKLAKTSHAPRAAGHMTRPPVSAKRPP